MESLYQEIILDHYRNPVGRGLREPFESEVHHVNPTCGDEITLRVHLRGTGSDTEVADVSYDNQGCSISQASASVMYELLSGQSTSVALAIGEEFLALMQSATSPTEPDLEALGDAVAFSGVAKYPARVKCALLAWMAFKDALALARGAQAGGGK
jgi:nitrogen fixation NifU-like protein